MCFHNFGLQLKKKVKFKIQLTDTSARGSEQYYHVDFEQKELFKH